MGALGRWFLHGIAEGVKLWVGCYGEMIGILVIAFVSLWDFFIMGLRGFFEWRIANTGIFVIYIGIGLILLGKHIDKETR